MPYRTWRLRYALLSLLTFPCQGFSADPQGVTAAQSQAEPPTCQVSPALEQQVNYGMAALDRIFMGPGDEQAKIKASTKDAYAVLVFPNVAKVGFFVTAAQGKGLLSYREADGHWSHPILVSARVSSVGPHFSMQTIDMMLVAKTHEDLLNLLSGKPLAQGAARQEMGAHIVTYSSNRGLTAGVSLDEFRIAIDQVANQGLYCQPILAEDFARPGHKMTVKPPPCAQKFAETMNRASGRAPITRQY